MKRTIKITVEVIDWESGEKLSDGNIYFFSRQHKWFDILGNLLSIRKEVKRLLKSL